MKLHAEMWDKMQDIMAKYNDHMVHFYIKFDGILYKQILKKALSIAIDNIPVLKSRYRSGFFWADWKVIENFNVDNIFFYKEIDGSVNSLEESEKFLLQIIDASKEAQIKVLLLRSGERDTLNLLINHQCIDGADVKEFVYLLSDIYNNLLEGGDGNIKIKKGTRSDKQLYENFTEKEKKEIEELVSYSKKQKHKITFAFETKNRKKLTPMIIKHSLSASVFQAMKNRAKEYGASVNDVILAAFFRVVHDMANVKEGQTLGIPNMVNLRRYIPGGVSAGFTNLTAMVVSSLEGGDIGKDIFETLEKVKTNMDELKKYYPGLHGLALLKVAFRYFPHGISKFLISTFFKNPLIGVSNIGIVEGGKMVFGEAKVEDTYITGSVKYPPYMQLALSTFNNIITFSVAVYGTKKDKEMFEEMYRRLDAEILAFIR